jgi:sugar lactone lactonase YvrE
VAGTAGKSGSTDGTGSDARFSSPNWLVADGAGNLYVADSGNNTIRKIVIATGVVTTLAGTPPRPGSVDLGGSADGIGPAAQFSNPNGLAVDGAGNLYVADSGNNTIRKTVLATGVVTTLAGTAGPGGSADGSGPAAQFNDPTTLATDGAGNLFIGDEGNATLRKLVIATGVVTTLPQTW